MITLTATDFIPSAEPDYTPARVTHIALGRVYSALDAYADRKGASKEMLHRAKLYARTVLQGNANTAPRSAAWAITEGRAVIDAGLSRTSLTREPLPPGVA